MAKKRFGGILPKLILIAVAMYALVSIIALNERMENAKAQESALRAQVEASALEIAELNDDIERKDDPEKIAELARDNFGLIESGETAFYDIGS